MKIETYFIPPKNYLHLGLYGDRLFALAHFIIEKDMKYIEFFKKQNKFITMDSGVAEGSRVPTKKIISCAQLINASEIICPDELYNSKKTIYLTKKFLSSLSKKEKLQFKFMMVPQSKDINNYVKCFKILQSLPECSCIGISKFDVPFIFGKKKDKHKVMQSRIRLIDYLNKNNIIEKPIHLLGYDNPKEFQYYIKNNYKFIRSCDSASAILCGMNNIRFNKKNGINVSKPVGGNRYHISEMTQQQIDTSLYNIKIVKQFCGK